MGSSNLCLLIGVNSRYEGTALNIKLRSRYLKGNFNTIQLGSLINLTFSTTNLSSNLKILKSLIEGNNIFCQDFVNSCNPILIANTEVFKRKDSLTVLTMLKLFIKYINIFSHSNILSQLNILSLTVNILIYFMNNFNIVSTER